MSIPVAPLVDRVRAEFLEMPGLKLTLRQAARLFGLDTQQSKHVLKELLDEGFLVCDTAGGFRRRNARDEGGVSPRRARTSEPRADLLEAMAVELPCVACAGSYRISLRKIRLSQAMMDEGCQARHFADCAPGAFAHLVEPDVLTEFETAVRYIEAAAEGAGGRLVGPR